MRKGLKLFILQKFDVQTPSLCKLTYLRPEVGHTFCHLVPCPSLWALATPDLLPCSKDGMLDQRAQSSGLGTESGARQPVLNPRFLAYLLWVLTSLPLSLLFKRRCVIIELSHRYSEDGVR